MRVGHVLRKYRRSCDKSLRAFSKEIGLSFATLARLENGNPVDGKTLATVLRWLMEPTQERNGIEIDYLTTPPRRDGKWDIPLTKGKRT